MMMIGSRLRLADRGVVKGISPFLMTLRRVLASLVPPVPLPNRDLRSNSEGLIYLFSSGFLLHDRISPILKEVRVRVLCALFCALFIAFRFRSPLVPDDLSYRFSLHFLG